MFPRWRLQTEQRRKPTAAPGRVLQEERGRVLREQLAATEGKGSEGLELRDLQEQYAKDIADFEAESK